MAAGLKAEGEGAVVGVVDDGEIEKSPVMISALDGTTLVATPECADEDDDQDRQHRNNAPPATVVGAGLENGGVKAGGSRAHKLMMLKFHMWPAKSSTSSTT